MRRMIKKQNGLTALGLVFILALVGLVVLIVLRLFPLYNEKFQVESALNSVASKPNAISLTNKKAGKAFLKALAVTNISRFTDDNIKESLVIIKPKKKGQPRILHLSYESRNVFVGDIYFVLVNDRKVPLTGPNVDG
jgi:uncharacterized protein DUF4845